MIESVHPSSSRFIPLTKVRTVGPVVVSGNRHSLLDPKDLQLLRSTKDVTSIETKTLHNSTLAHIPKR